MCVLGWVFEVRRSGREVTCNFSINAFELSDERNNICKHCSARTWKKESINCCGRGRHVVHRLTPLPQGVFDAFSIVFFRNQRTYNNLFSFTCLGASPGKAWVQMKPPALMKLHGRQYHASSTVVGIRAITSSQTTLACTFTTTNKVRADLLTSTAKQ